MRLLLFSDLHRDTDATQALLKQANDFDVLIGAGDFANAHTGLDDCLTILHASPKPIVIVPGNNETLVALTRLCGEWPQFHILHGTGTTIGGVDFYGVGGGIPVTPFGSWSYDFTEDQAEELLTNCPKNSVLVTHSPPKGAVDRNSQGQSFGSISIRKCILEKEPRLVVCGHIHASAQKMELVGKTPVVNAGPRGYVFELQEV